MHLADAFPVLMYIMKSVFSFTYHLFQILYNFYNNLNVFFMGFFISVAKMCEYSGPLYLICR